jgi:2-succinyl-5-enolpyruvyl-6-hydroxy-3-cyclohexene-1-carboxylate synthase
MVIGDVAFHYDANALLTDPVPSELRIVVMNNGGGGIFRWLPGTQHPDLFERHFETPPNRTVEAQAKAMGATHFLATNEAELREALSEVVHTSGPTVLEVRTPSAQSAAVLTDYLAAFRCETKSTFS